MGVLVVVGYKVPVPVDDNTHSSASVCADSSLPLSAV